MGRILDRHFSPRNELRRILRFPDHLGLAIGRSNLNAGDLAGRSVTISERDEDVHVRMMRLIDRNPAISQRELARELDLSIGKVNYLVRALVERGMVKAQNFRANPNKRAYAYYLTPAGMFAKAALTRRFLARKLEEYDLLRAEIDALQSEVSALPSGDAAPLRAANFSG